MASNADATAGTSKGWHDLEAVLDEELVARLMATYLALPTPVLHLTAAIGEVIGGGMLTRETLGMLTRGNTADVRPAAEALGWQPRSLAIALTAEPATEADRWHARLLPVRPALQLGLAAVWIGSGIVSAFLAPL